MPRKLMTENGGACAYAADPAMAASRFNRKNGKYFKRKTSRASSEAAFSMRSGVSGFRVKSAFLVGRRGSPSTPMPTWKVHGATPMPIKMEKQYANGSVALHATGHDLYDEHCHHHLARRHISARKLAAALWELQGLPLSKGRATRTPQECTGMNQAHTLADMSNQSKCGNQRARPLIRPFSPASSMSPSSPGAMQVKGMRTVSVGRHESRGANRKICTARATPRNSILEIEAISRKLDFGREVATNELVKVLNHMWSLEERHEHTMSVVNALQAEVDQAYSQLRDFSLRENALSKEVENATRRIVEERAMWQEQQENSVREARLSIRQELDAERKSKQKLEGLHKKVMKELRDERRKLDKVLEELEKERRARELMEDVCDELAREVGEDKARVEELKCESLKVREEVEEERKMLQMAELWREERVQMKLMEAKLELEEKNTALDNLRSELEMFVKAKRDSNIKEDATTSQHTYRHSRDASSGQSFADLSHPNEQRVLASHHRSLDSVGNGPSKIRSASEGEGSEGEVDLHSIELNNKVFLMPQDSQDQYTYGSVCKGRKSVEERPPHGACARVQGLQHPTSNNQDERRGGGETGVEKDGLYDHLQVSQWIECSFEGGEMKEWGDLEQRVPVQTAREEQIRSWQDRTGFTHGPVSSSLRVNAWTESHEVESRKRAQTKSGPLGDCKEDISSRDQPDRLHQMLNFQNVQLNSLLGNGHEGPNLASSPIREWEKRELGFCTELGTESSRGVLDKARAGFWRRRG